MRLIIAMAVVALVTACSTKNLSTRMTSWQGSHIDEISSAWGLPDECIESDGREFCSWSSAATDRGTGLNPDTFKARPICVRTVEIDDTGVITGWRWRGDRCASTASEVLAKTSPSRPEQLAIRGEQSTNLEVAVIEPAAQPAITRIQ